jgi:hypothetical protein
MRFYLFKRVIFNCKKATLLILKMQDGNATLGEQVQLIYHKLYCNVCRRFAKQSKKINTILVGVNQHEYENPSHNLPDTLKKDLQAQIDQLNK